MTGFSTRSRVYWHGVFPDFSKQGRTVEVGKATDVRQRVLWDDTTEPQWVSTGMLRKVSEHRSCDCGGCGK